MRRLTLGLPLALLAFSFGCLAAFFWEAHHPPAPLYYGTCFQVESLLPPHTLLLGVAALFVAVPALILWLERHPPEADTVPADAQARDSDTGAV